MLRGISQGGDAAVEDVLDELGALLNVCKHCEKEFTPKRRVNAEYCSNVCSTAAWGKENRDKRNKHHKKWRENNREKYLKIKKDYYKNNPNKVKLYNKGVHIKSKYGLSIEQVNNAINIQNGRCAICMETTVLNIDHCHKTKKFRGMLCRNCNVALGLIKDNVSSLARAIEYLNNSNED